MAMEISNRNGISHALWTLLLLVCLCVPAAASPPRLDNAALRQALIDERFELLERHFGALHAATREPPGDDRPMGAALAAFSTTDPRLERPLSNWIERHPESAFARAARGRHYSHLGWAARGAAYARNTPDSNFERMQAHFDAATGDLREAVRLDPELSAAYAMLIGMPRTYRNTMTIDDYIPLVAYSVGSMASTLLNQLIGDFITEQLMRFLFLLREVVLGPPPEYVEPEDFSEVALQRHPGSVLVAWQRMFRLQPKWGGSIDEIETYLETLEPMMEEVSALRPLRGYPHYVRGDEARRNDHYQDAIAHFDKALRHGPEVDYLLGRADAWWQLGELDAAIADYSAALEQSWGAETLRRRAQVYQKQERYKLALVDLDAAIELDPLAPRILRVRSHVLSQQFRKREALADVEASLIYDPENKWAHDMIRYLKHTL